MALLKRNLNLMKKFAFSFNYIKTYSKICIPSKFAYNFFHSDLLLGGVSKWYEQQDARFSPINLEFKNKSSDVNKEKPLKEVAVYIPIQKVYGHLLTKLNLSGTDSSTEKATKYILNQNVSINKWNEMFPNITEGSALQKRSKKTWPFHLQRRRIAKAQMERFMF